MIEREFDLVQHRQLYQYLLEHPGIHLRKIARDTRLNLSTLRYRLDQWEKQGLVVSRKEQNLKVYFVADRLSKAEKATSSLLQQKRFRNILVTLLVKAGSTHTELQKELGLKPSTLTKYMKVVEKEGLVRSERDGRQKRYFIEDEDHLTRLLVSYRRSFWDGFVDSVLEIYFER